MAAAAQTLQTKDHARVHAKERQWVKQQVTVVVVWAGAGAERDLGGRLGCVLLQVVSLMGYKAQATSDCGSLENLTQFRVAL